MKQLLSDQGDSDDEPQIQETPEQDSPNSNYVFSGLIDPLPLSHPSLAQITFLCNHYIANVHPVIPIMHGPSLESSIQTAFENRENIPSGLEAILFAVCLSAVASMAESECLIGLGIPKDVALRDYRRNAERALVKGNLVNKPELATLQALTIYLVIKLWFRPSDSPNPQDELFKVLTSTLSLQLEQMATATPHGHLQVLLSALHTVLIFIVTSPLPKGHHSTLNCAAVCGGSSVFLTFVRRKIEGLCQLYMAGPTTPKSLQTSTTRISNRRAKS